MASRTWLRARSDMSHSGSLSSLAHLPSRLSPYLAGPGLASQNIAECSGSNRSCRSCAPRHVAGAPGLLHVGAKARRDIGADRDAADAAGGVERDRRGILTRQLAKSRIGDQASLDRSRQVAGGVLDADDAVQLGQPRHRFHRHVDHRAARHIVHEDGQTDRVVDRLEMAVEALLARFIIGRHHHHHSIGAGFLARLGVMDADGRRGGARTGDHGHPAGRRLDAQRDNARVFGIRKGCRLAGRAAGYEALRAFGDLPLDKRLERALVDSSPGHGGYQRYQRSAEHVVLPTFMNASARP